MRRLAALLAACVAFSVVPAGAALADDSAVIRVYEPGGMAPETIEATQRAAQLRGGDVAFFHTGTLKLHQVRRGDQVLQEAPAGMAYPMSTLAFDPVAAQPLFSPALTRVLSLGLIAMGRTSADLRGADVGDAVVVTGWDGELHELRLGLIADDDEVGYAELIMSDEIAESVGLVRVSSAAVWDYDDEDHLNVLIQHGTESLIRVTSPGDAPSPDSVLPSAVLKTYLGEFAYRETGRGDWIEIEEGWRADNIVFINHPLTGRFPCHRLVAPLIERGLDEIMEMGIGSLIDLADFQAAGGCFVPRLIRGGDKGGAVSRHAYGAAIDLNPSDNRYGGEISMDIRIVRVFRDLGFAWGGGWTFTDGMHFEYSPPAVPSELLD